MIQRTDFSQIRSLTVRMGSMSLQAPRFEMGPEKSQVGPKTGQATEFEPASITSVDDRAMKILSDAANAHSFFMHMGGGKKSILCDVGSELLAQFLRRVTKGYRHGTEGKAVVLLEGIPRLLVPAIAYAVADCYRLHAVKHQIDGEIPSDGYTVELDNSGLKFGAYARPVPSIGAMPTLRLLAALDPKGGNIELPDSSSRIVPVRP